jgi:hypothetical protein
MYLERGNVFRHCWTGQVVPDGTYTGSALNVGLSFGFAETYYAGTFGAAGTVSVSLSEEAVPFGWPMELNPGDQLIEAQPQALTPEPSGLALGVAACLSFIFTGRLRWTIGQRSRTRCERKSSRQ